MPHIHSQVQSQPTMHCVNTQPTRTQVKDANTAIHRAGEEAGCKCVYRECSCSERLVSPSYPAMISLLVHSTDMTLSLKFFKT